MEDSRLSRELALAQAKVAGFLRIVTSEVQMLPAPLAFARILSLLANMYAIAVSANPSETKKAIAEWICKGSDDEADCLATIEPLVEALVEADRPEDVERAVEAILKA